MNYLEFVDWYEERYEENWKYIENRKYYGFRFVFFNESGALKKGEIFPIYPWNENFKKEVIGDRVENFFLCENVLLKEKIVKLELKLKELEEFKKK
jgi:hypothetical protein